MTDSELRHFLQTDLHLAPRGFVVRVLNACRYEQPPVETVEQLRQSSILKLPPYCTPNIGAKTIAHLRHLLEQAAMTEKVKTVSQELQTALVALDSAETIYHGKIGSDFRDVTDARSAIERALSKIQHHRCMAAAALEEF